MKSGNIVSGSSDSHELSVDIEEVLGFQARFLLDLPLATSLIVRTPDSLEEIVWTTRVLEKPRQPSGKIWFDKEEVRALISASESERAWPNDFREWCWMKRESPDFVVDSEIALSGAKPTTHLDWNVGRILSWLALELVSATVSRAIDSENGSVAKAA